MCSNLGPQQKVAEGPPLICIQIRKDQGHTGICTTHDPGPQTMPLGEGVSAGEKDHFNTRLAMDRCTLRWQKNAAQTNIMGATTKHALDSLLSEMDLSI